MSLIKCPECNKEISDKAERCINCGFPITVSMESKIDEKVIPGLANFNVGDNTVIQKAKIKLLSNRWRKRILITLSAIILVFISYYIMSNYITKKGQAIQAVNNYLEALQNGDSTYEFQDFLYADFDVDEFDDVYNFKFEKIKGVHEVENKPITFDMDFYEEFEKTSYSSFQEFKDSKRKLYESLGGKVLSEDAESITVYDGKKHDVIYLVYEIDASHSVFGDIKRRVTFSAENDNSDEKFKVTSFFW